MKWQVALVREHGVDFAVVVVKQSVLSGLRSTKDELVATFSLEFSRPAVLMAQDLRGVPEYYGRRDIVNFLANIFPEQLPWREFTLRAA